MFPSFGANEILGVLLNLKTRLCHLCPNFEEDKVSYSLCNIEDEPRSSDFF